MPESCTVSDALTAPEGALTFARVTWVHAAAGMASAGDVDVASRAPFGPYHLTATCAPVIHPAGT